jgi:hypothetical protein
MSITLEERLRRAADLMDEVAVQPSAIDVRASSRDGRDGSSMLVRAAAVLLVVAGVVGVAAVASRSPSDPSSSPSEQTSNTPTATDDASATTPAVDATAAAPATAAPENTAPATTAGSATETTMVLEEPFETLPASVDLSTTPITVAGSSPTSWYRLQPDLDVAWYSDGTGSWLCFRTPVMEECQLDRFFPGGYVAAQSALGQWLIVTFDEVDEVREVIVTFDDGTRRVVGVRQDSQIGWSVGRVTGGTPSDASMVFDTRDASSAEEVAPPTTAGDADVGATATTAATAAFRPTP